MNLRFPEPEQICDSKTGGTLQRPSWGGVIPFRPTAPFAGFRWLTSLISLPVIA